MATPPNEDDASFSWTLRGTAFPGPDSTDFVGRLFDDQGRVIAPVAWGTLPFVLAPRRAGRPPKDARHSLALLSAYHLARAELAFGGQRITPARGLQALNYADDKSARRAPATARQRLDKLLPPRAWHLVWIAGAPQPLPELPDVGPITASCVFGTGTGPAGDSLNWTGRAIAVFLPAGFEPRSKLPPPVRWIDGIR